MRLKMKVNYYFDTFSHLKPFDILSYDYVVSLYMKNYNLLNESNVERLGGWNERPINSDVDEIEEGGFWYGYDPVYFNVAKDGEELVKVKADVVSMDMQGLNREWTHFIYFELPYTLINDYMIAMHDCPDVSIARKFIDEVESTEKEWDEENWKFIMKKYDKKYPKKSSYTDYFETHEKEFEWRMDFNPYLYINMKNNGIIYPVCYNDKYHMLDRGTHRAVLLAQSKSDIPILLQYPNMDLDENIVYDVGTPKHFGGKPLTMNVDVKNKKLKFFIEDKLVGEV
jgi:hypothetical protein